MSQTRPITSPPLEVRFWSKVERMGDDECWPWRGCIQTRGYGQFHVGMVDGKEKRVPAHRVAWELWMGVPVPEGLVIDHICKTTACCNPHHLRPVRQQDNCMALAKLTPFYWNKKKTHCKEGHPFEGANLARYYNPSRDAWTRVCLTCHPTYWRWAVIPREPPPGATRPISKLLLSPPRQSNGSNT